MIDWLTLKIDAMELSQKTFDYLRSRGDRIYRVTADGSVVWEMPARETVRSDSHQVSMEFGSQLLIYGSPARLMTGSADNVFGSDDVRACAAAMVNHIANTLGYELPGYLRWSCTRLDVTENYNLGDESNVKQALSLLRHSEGGRYQVRTTSESVYWSTNSTYRSGKAYGKGAHLEYLIKRGQLQLDQHKLQAAAGLLRLELSLRRHFFRKVWKQKWHQLTAADLAKEHAQYFDQLVGDCEVTEMTDLQQHFAQVAVDIGLTPGQGRAAFASWQWILATGYNDWREGCPRATFYRHRKILLAAGLSYADFQARKVVPFRKRHIVLDRPVKSWTQLLATA
jgi:II/X family phage/plasmid replication protein